MNLLAIIMIILLYWFLSAGTTLISFERLQQPWLTLKKQIYCICPLGSCLFTVRIVKTWNTSCQLLYLFCPLLHSWHTDQLINTLLSWISVFRGWVSFWLSEHVAGRQVHHHSRPRREDQSEPPEVSVQHSVLLPGTSTVSNNYNNAKIIVLTREEKC